MQRWRVIISLMLFSFELQEGWEGFCSEEGGRGEEHADDNDSLARDIPLNRPKVNHNRELICSHVLFRGHATHDLQGGERLTLSEISLSLG